MQRHFAGAYVVPAIEFLMGGPLAYVALMVFPKIFRQHRVKLDDGLVFTALAVTGAATLAAAAATLLHTHLSYDLLRRVRIGAAISDVWMLLIGVGMWVIARQRGGEWTGLGVLGAFLFIAVGTTLLSFSVFALIYVRRMRPGINSPI